MQIFISVKGFVFRIYKVPPQINKKKINNSFFFNRKTLKQLIRYFTKGYQKGQQAYEVILNIVTDLTYILGPPG